MTNGPGAFVIAAVAHAPFRPGPTGRFADVTPLRRTLPALTAVALLAVAGCGGSSKNATATTPAAVAPPADTATAATHPGKPAKLEDFQLLRVSNATQSFLSAQTTYISKVSRCVVSARPKACVKRVVKPAETSVASMRNTATRLYADVSGDCALQIDALAGKISEVTDVLGPVAQAASTGSRTVVTRLVPNVQDELRAFASAAAQVQTVCAP
jgi:hypothetical protein